MDAPPAPPPPPRSPLRPPPPPPTIQSVLSKRQHALHELMSSERAYASDLTLILEVHIPLAQGPMTAEDIKLIFGNIAELAELSDVFCEALERTIGSALDDPDATDDHIGELFLRFAPELEGPYKQYITRHPSALAHLTALPVTPELTAYHQKTRDLAVSLSHAWDLASLLIKPVQRLLKYSLLITAIIDATAPTHPDRPHLLDARTAMEDVARQVNEGRRRAEVVKEVLTAPKKPPTVLRIKSFRAPTDPNSDAARVERMQAELARIDVFAQQLARTAQEWARGADAAARALLAWAKSFALAIGLSAAVRSEAFDTFLDTLTARILPAASALLPSIAADLLAPLARLLASAAQPRQLLSSMDEYAPLHHHLLTMPVTPKNRPPPALLSASAHYLALRTQLAAELPAYLALLHRGLAALVRRLAALQAAFFGQARDAWAGLWDMLRVEGERNGGGEETVGVWRGRWGDVDGAVRGLAICRPVRGSMASQSTGSVLSQSTGPPMTPAEAVARAYTDPINVNTSNSSSKHSSGGSGIGSALGYGGSMGMGIGMAFGSPDSLPYSPQSQLAYSPPSPHYERTQHHPYSNQQNLNASTSSYTHHLHNHTAQNTNNGNRRDSSGASIATSSSGNTSSSGKAAHVSSVLAALDPPSASSRRLHPNGSTASAILGALGQGQSYTGGGGTPPISGPYPLGVGARQRERERERAGPSAYSPPNNNGGFAGWNENSGRGKSPLRNGTGDSSNGGYFNDAETNGADAYGSNGNGNGSRTPRRPKSPTPTTKTNMTAKTAGTARDGGDEFGEFMSEMGWGDYSAMVLPPKKIKDPAREEEKAREKERERRRKEEEKEERARRKEEKKRAGKGMGMGGSGSLGGSNSNSNTNSAEPSPRSSLASSRLALLEGAGYGLVSQKGRSKDKDNKKEKEKSKSRDKEGKEKRPQSRDGGHGERHSGSNPGSNRNSNGRRAAATAATSVCERGCVRLPARRARPAGTTTARTRSRPPSPSPTRIDPSFETYDPSAFTTDARRATWLTAPVLYTCRVVHPCTPPAAAPSYFGFPFFALEAHALLGVLHEAGHPGSHPRLPLYVDEGEDCLLLCRDAGGRVGWALASFLAPLVGE
ncbi:hypothetical protein K438DRAFT_2070497 [Mycena galopus ATCC 62051]|nr:hypothetical protein K438DRAFT_2070497 [Mycena galopus ATCC 62051]